MLRDLDWPSDHSAGSMPAVRSSSVVRSRSGSSSSRAVRSLAMTVSTPVPRASAGRYRTVAASAEECRMTPGRQDVPRCTQTRSPGQNSPGGVVTVGVPWCGADMISPSSRASYGRCCSRPLAAGSVPTGGWLVLHGWLGKDGRRRVVAEDPVGGSSPGTGGPVPSRAWQRGKVRARFHGDKTSRRDPARAWFSVTLCRPRFHRERPCHCEVWRIGPTTWDFKHAAFRYPSTGNNGK